MRHNEGDGNIDASSQKRFKFMLLLVFGRSNILMMGTERRFDTLPSRNWTFLHVSRVCDKK